MEREYVLITDTNSDLPKEFFAENDVPVILMPFHIDGKDYTENDMTHKEFYDQIRQGKTPTTTQFTAVQAEAFFEPFLKQGKDVLHIAFSSGMSATADSCAMAARQLQEKYPDRTIYVLDSLCASMGQGLFFYKLLQMKQAGKSMDELIEWGENNKLKVAHYVMAEDLMHLHRGGRVSKTSAIMGTMLGIKPIIYVNDEGRLIPVAKGRGRKQGLQTLVDTIAKAVGNAKNDIVFISHSDCLEDAEYTAQLVKKKFGVEKFMINYIGPVVGSHTGIGTIALFMMGEHR